MLNYHSKQTNHVEYGICCYYLEMNLEYGIWKIRHRMKHSGFAFVFKDDPISHWPVLGVQI